MVNQRHHELWLIQRNENDWDWLLVWMKTHAHTQRKGRRERDVDDESNNAGIFSSFHL